jgi:capsular exopolysaccharide synthesis family protein
MELKTYINPLLKWWWFIILASAFAGASSYVAVRNQPPTYQARTALMIGRTIDDPNPTGTQFTLSQQLAQTYVDIARREPVYNATKEVLGLNRLPPYSVNAVPNTQLIEIAVVDTSPERSYVVATELANQLIRLSPSGLQQEEQERQEFISQQLSDLQNQIEETQAEIELQKEALGDLFSAQQIGDAQTEIAALQVKLNTLQGNYAALLANTQQGAINALTIIENATIPTVPINSNKMTTILTAAAIGFVLAAGTAYLLEYLDDSVKTPADIKQVSKLPTLAGIATIKLENETHKLVTHEQPRSPISEAFRILRTSIQFSSVDHPRRKLLITSPGPAEGKSVTAANLAIVIAQAGYNVLLIDADLRRPMQHNLFELSPMPGLTTLLLESNITDGTYNIPQPERFIQKTAVANLHLLASGVIPPNPSELLGSTRMKAALETLSAQFDFLIIDSPPILALADSIVLSTQTDGVILVARAKKTKGKQLKMTVERLREVDAHIIGVSLNGVSSKGDGFAYYYYQGNEFQNIPIEKRSAFFLNSKRANGSSPQIETEAPGVIKE